MDPTSTGAGGIVALKTVFIQTLIASLAGLMGFVLIRPRTVREAVWRFFGAAISSVIFGPFVVAAVHSVWPDLLASANTLAAGDGVGFASLYFTAPIQIASGLPIWWLLGLGARWMESNRSMTLGSLFDNTITSIARSRNAVRGDPGQVRMPPQSENKERRDETQ